MLYDSTYEASKEVILTETERMVIASGQDEGEWGFTVQGILSLSFAR